MDAAITPMTRKAPTVTSAPHVPRIWLLSMLKGDRLFSSNSNSRKVSCQPSVIRARGGTQRARRGTGSGRLRYNHERRLSNGNSCSGGGVAADPVERQRAAGGDPGPGGIKGGRCDRGARGGK